MSQTAGTTERNWTHWTEPSWIEVDGLRTAYRRKGEGEPLLYLHGAGLTRAWLPLYEELSKTHDVIVPEHPGFGDTPMPQWLRGMDDLVLHYDAFLDALGVEAAHLVGHSLGGWLGAYMAFFYPRRFTTLTLITPAGLRVPEATMTDIFRLGTPAIFETLLSGAPLDKYMDYFRQDTEIEDMIHAYSESITLARLMWNPRYDSTLDRRVQRIRIPTLVIGARDDRIVPNVHAERWAELVPGATLTVLDGEPDEPTSHLLIIQQPERLARTIAEHAVTA